MALANVEVLYGTGYIGVAVYLLLLLMLLFCYSIGLEDLDPAELLSTGK